MAITVVGSDATEETDLNTNGMTLTLPTHQIDDVGIIWAKQIELGTIPDLSIGTATGWTEQWTRNHTNGTDRVVSLFYKVFTSASETNPVVNTDVAGWRGASVTVFRGVDTADVFDSRDPQDTATNNNGNVAPPSITPNTDNGAYMALYSSVGGSGGWGSFGAPATPSGMVIGANSTGPDNDSQVHCVSYVLDYGTAAAINPTVWTHDLGGSSSRDASVVSIVLKPASVATAPYQSLMHMGVG